MAGSLTGNGVDAYKYGVAASVSQNATTILDRFISIPPAITVREGYRVKVYISQDMLLPAVENHTIPPNFREARTMTINTRFPMHVSIAALE